MSEITLLLDDIKAGKSGAQEQLWQIVYEELRALARGLMAREQRQVTINGTALVHEAWLRLCGAEKEQTWDSRGHFFSVAAEAMRRILVDRARSRSRKKRGGDQFPVELDYAVNVASPHDETILAVNEALETLSQSDPQKAQIVKLRFFAGFNNAEIAEILGVGERSVGRDWALAKIWLYKALKP